MQRMLASLLVIGAAASVAAPAAAQSRASDTHFTWSGAVDAGRMVYVRNLNGPVRVEASSGTTVEVVADKHTRRGGDPKDVVITAVQRSARGDVVVCAVWNERTRCDEDGYSSSGSRDRWWNWDDRDRGEVAVEFVVRIPKGVRVTSSTVNGDLEIEGVDAEVNANSVNGGITARSTGGPVRARTVNGSLRIRTGTLGTGSLEYSTTNGSITLEIPEGSNADVSIHTVNGGISTDFPLTIEGRFSRRDVRGTIGKGGPSIRLSTVNGAVNLRRA